MSEKVKFDTALYTAVQQLKQQQLAQLPDIEILLADFNPSQSFAHRINQLFYSAERKYKTTRMLASLGKIAVAILLAITLLLSNQTVATAMKNIISQTVIQWFDKYISVETKADEYPRQIKDFTVGYMTDGFVLEETYNIDTGIKKVYYKDNLYINIKIKPDDGNDIASFDIEYSTASKILIDGREALWISHNDGYNRFLISVNGVQYSIDGYVHIDEILEIYENIEIFL